MYIKLRKITVSWLSGHACLCCGLVVHKVWMFPLSHGECSAPFQYISNWQLIGQHSRLNDSNHGEGENLFCGVYNVSVCNEDLKLLRQHQTAPSIVLLFKLLLNTIVSHEWLAVKWSSVWMLR